MPLKSLLVFMDASEDSSTRLDVACGLAEQCDAHLDALSMSLQIFPYAAASLDAGAAAIDIGQIEEAKQRAQQVAAEAQKVIEARGLSGEARWTSRELSGLREAAAIQARFAELTVAGQPVAGSDRSLREWAFEGALFSSGRPVLLIPSSWKSAINVRHVIVAWDASREAARALGDAIPFIEQAEKTTIVIVDPEPGNQAFGDEPGADIARVLARHCDNVAVDRVPSSGASIAQALLVHTVDAAGDVIVMGGYGHSPLRESIFGGVSSEMIRQTTVPLLLSH